jgi:serine/threonine protein kinase
LRRFKEDAARFYAANVLLALKKLHELDIVYRE